MSTMYWFALIVGAGLLGLSLFGDLFGGGDGLDVDGGVDFDVDADVDVDGDHAATDGFRILSTRNLTYFLFGFGATGVLLSWLWDGGTIMTAVLATVIGLTAGGIAALAFGWLGRTESGQLLDDAGWAGRSGEVTMSLRADGMGKIMVERGGRSHELLARAFDRSARQPENWTTVMTVEMRDGVAFVSVEPDALSSGADYPSSDPRRLPHDLESEDA